MAVGFQGLSFVLSDRQPITSRPAFQGLSFELPNRQGFNLQLGFKGLGFEMEPVGKSWKAEK